MAYCTVEELESKVTFPTEPYSDTTDVTRDAVEGHIDDIASQMNMALRGAGYVLPITDAESLTYLRMVNGWGAGSLAREGVSTIHNGNVGATAEDLWKKYTNELTKWESGKFVLPSAQMNSGLPRSLSNTYAADGSDPNISDNTPMRRRDEVF